MTGPEFVLLTIVFCRLLLLRSDSRERINMINKMEWYKSLESCLYRIEKYIAPKKIPHIRKKNYTHIRPTNYTKRLKGMKI
jgi:hypothetical protein